MRKRVGYAVAETNRCYSPPLDDSSEYVELGTTPEPHNPTTALVTSGPFRYSRNPIYISKALLYVGISMVANAVWPLLLLPSVLFALTRGMIEREEGYLEHRFGDQYRQYRESVSRWL